MTVPARAPGGWGEQDDEGELAWKGECLLTSGVPGSVLVTVPASFVGPVIITVVRAFLMELSVPTVPISSVTENPGVQPQGRELDAECRLGVGERRVP